MRKGYTVRAVWRASFGSLVAVTALVCGRASAGLPENLAREAKAWASSEYSDRYLAKFAVDGKIPQAGSQGADLGAAWCVRKEKSGDKGVFSLQWNQPVKAAMLVYWGRTSWFPNECWKDYEVYLDDETRPAAKGRFRMVHGPQPVKLPDRPVGKLTVRFLNSYGGYNPGALEIQVFPRVLSRSELKALARRFGATGLAAGVGEVDPEALEALIRQLADLHGAYYAQSEEHLRRLGELRDQTSPEAEDALRELQREVLLFDVDETVAIKRHEIVATHVYTYHYEGFRPGGGLYRLSLKDPAKPPRLLAASPEGQILDCDVSFDGKRLLFSWRRKRDEGYHLWVANADGSGLKQLTNGPWHDYNACWLPDGGIAFLSSRTPQFAYCWHAPVGILHRMNADGTGVRRLSANYLNDFTPAVLDDGRIIYTRWEYVDRPAIPIQSLWAIRPDGTGLAGYFGNRVLSPGTFMGARPVPGTQSIVCTMTGHNGPTRGALGVVTRWYGDNAQGSIENITPDVPVPPVNQGNGNTGGTKQYSGPYPLDTVRLLCSARGPLLVRTFDRSCQSVALAPPGDGMQWFNARPLRARPRPPALPSNLPAHSDGMATLYLQDVYDGLEPFVARGGVVTLRVVRELQKSVRIDPRYRAFGFQFPVISCGATYAGKQVLGEAAVEPDGSAHFRVPANLPLYFEALDAQGRAVQRMRSFTHLKPGERRGCIGCHEPRSRAPKTRLPAAWGKPPRELRPPEWGRGGFDYWRIVQPVLDKHCTRCHNPSEAPKGMDLTGDKTDYFNVSYDVLARENQGREGSPYVNWIPTYNGHEQNILKVAPRTWGSPRSKLAEVVLSGHPDAEGKPRAELKEAERRRILAWIDLDVPYYGTSETAYPQKQGCRRLYPANLDKVLGGVARRRCAECHRGGRVPRRVWTRITHPELNNFLLAPLAKAAGGTEKCGRVVFTSTEDPDYRAILATFTPILEELKQRPRMDMPGASPDPDVSRSCQ